MNFTELVQGEDVVHIAKRLLGATISTKFDGELTSGIIVESEAYKAPEDKGSHAYANRRTTRTETLFGPPGNAYVYLCYGLHHLFNVVTASQGLAHAVLIRAIEPVKGREVMTRRRNLKRPKFNLTNGPGKLSQALGITTKHNGQRLLGPTSMISINLTPDPVPSNKIICSPRVGIAYAEECAHWPWRFRIVNNSWTSLPKEVSY